MILCYKRSRDSRRDDNSNNSARYVSRPSATARSGFASGARSGPTIGSPAAIEMGATEPVVGIPVWINTDGVMNGLAGGSPGPLSPSTMGVGGAGREGGEPAGGDGHEDGEEGEPRPPANRAAECAPNGDSL